MPHVATVAFELIVLEVTFICIAVSPAGSTMAVFLPCNKVANERGFIWPDLHSKALLLVFEPIASVLRSIKVCVGTKAFRLVIFPLTLVHVSICMNEAAIPIDSIIEKISFVNTTIRPHDDTWAVTLQSFTMEVAPTAHVALERW